MPGLIPDAVLGFVFSGDKRSPYVALIEKDHPEWQKGKFNGIGGKKESGETSLDAMVREFREESGLLVPPEQWRRVVRLYSRATDYVMWVYTAHIPEPLALKEDGPEPCFWCAADNLPTNVLPNLRWLVPLCLDERIGGDVVVHYSRPPEDKECTPSTST